MTVNLILALAVSPGALALWICTYIFVIKKKGQGERCTTHTIGMIIRYSSINYSGIYIPLAEYYVDGKRYLVAGPKFTGAIVTRISTPFHDPNTKSETNLTTRENLPTKLRVKIYKNSHVSNFRSPLTELYPIHSEVDIYYNPSKPKDAFVQRFEGASKVLAFIFIPLSIISLLVIIGCFIAPQVPL
ncbi:MAG: hypothetical protein R3Y40_02125 [Eubacteriales bacterium]